MNTKILLKVDSKKDFFDYKGDFDGVYFNSPNNYFELLEDKELFIDVTNLSTQETIEVCKKINGARVSFVVDSVMKAVFIKSIIETAKISYYLDGYDREILPFISANRFDVTIKYTALAPERVEELHRHNAKINCVFLSRLDEVDVLKYYLADYVTVVKDVKP